LLVKKGDLVKMTHTPYLYGIITGVSWRAVWVFWTGHETVSGYEPSTVEQSMEIVVEGR
jgi:hypothetical protein